MLRCAFPFDCRRISSPKVTTSPFYEKHGDMQKKAKELVQIKNVVGEDAVESQSCDYFKAFVYWAAGIKYLNRVRVGLSILLCTRYLAHGWCRASWECLLPTPLYEAFSAEMVGGAWFTQESGFLLLPWPFHLPPHSTSIVLLLHEHSSLKPEDKNILIRSSHGIMKPKQEGKQNQNPISTAMLISSCC